MLKIGILLGDDIGLEVVPEAVKIMKAAAARTGVAIEWHPLPIGRLGHESHGHTFPQVTQDALPQLHGWLQGPMGHSAYPRNDPTWANPPTRKRYDLFALAAQRRRHRVSARDHRGHDALGHRLRRCRRVPSER